MKGPTISSASSPLPLGARITSNGINFSIFSRHASRVELVIALPQHKKKTLRFPFDSVKNKTGDIWHILITNLTPPFWYGYRFSGHNHADNNGNFFDDSLILLDPNATVLKSEGWGEPRPYLGHSASCLLDKQEYDWEDDRYPKIPMQDSIIYELHVRGFTQHMSSLVSHPGTFRGLTEKIHYLQQLGVTAVELLPVIEFDENEALFVNPQTGLPLKNYWGYNPLSFFAPKASYSSEPGKVLTEFRDMVKAFHRAGIEVLLDIVFNHSGEGGQGGPTTSFRGIDNSIYYLLDPWTRAYLNFTGCGNTINCNHPVIRSLIRKALHFWVVEMHVDGFRFDLASIMNRGTDGKVLANAPVVELLAEDPVLADTKIIAEAWDAGGLYQVGDFSSNKRWVEWNGRFRDDVRSFMCGYAGKVPALATRIAGSSDLYRSYGKGPCNSINFITSHDGFTLSDLVSYNEKHNLANGEDNRDGESNNISWNSGAEGETSDPAILALRQRRIRSFMVILFLSSGVPMLVAGDEFGRSQRGNNNAWCQDNATSWLDWGLAEKNRDLLRFCSMLISLRKKHSIFRRTTFFPQEHDKTTSTGPAIRWFGQNNETADWSHESRTLAFLLNGACVNPAPDDDFFVMLNGSADTQATFTVPKPRDQFRHWVRIVDTSAKPPSDILTAHEAPTVPQEKNLILAPMGCVVLQSRTRLK